MRKSVSKGGIILIVILIVLVLAIYLTFFYTPTCKSISCWEAKLLKCSKAKYINDPRDVTWSYNIQGKDGDKCRVEVGIVNVKKGLTKTEVLEGKR